jgi:hypothetical protein
MVYSEASSFLMCNRTTSFLRDYGQFTGRTGDGMDHSSQTNHQMQFTFGSPASFDGGENAQFTPEQILSGQTALNQDADGDGQNNAFDTIHADPD